MPGKFSTDPHPALLPVLLMMTRNVGDVEKTLDELINFMQSTKTALESMRSGVETFQAGMLKMAPPPGRPGTPAAWSGPPSPAPKQKDSFSNLPANDPVGTTEENPVKENNGEPGQAP